MPDTKDLTDRDRRAVEIIESCDKIDKYGIAPEGTYYPNFSEKTGYTVVYYMYVRIGEERWIPYYAGENSSLMNCIKLAIKEGNLSAYDVYEDPCNKCHGTGYIRGYEHVMNGVCFKCGGTGQSK